jgi:hypothetical protein
MPALPSLPGDQNQVEFDRRHRALALFAQAIGDRPFKLVPCAASVFQAHLRTADPDRSTLLIPIAQAAASRATMPPIALRIGVMREALRRDPPQDVDAANPPGKASPRRWPVRPPTPPRIERRLHGVLERMRVDARILRDYPGARAELSAIRAAALAYRSGPLPRGELHALIAVFTRISLGACPEPWLRTDPHGLLKQVLAIAQPVLDVDASAADCAVRAHEIARILERFALRERRIQRYLTVHSAVLRDEPAPGLPGSTALTGPAKVDPTRPASPHAMPIAAGTQAPPPTGTMATTTGEALSGGQAVAADVEAAPDATTVLTDDPAASGKSQAVRPSPAARRSSGTFLYDEWDWLSGTYLSAWCRVHEHRLRGDRLDFAQEVRSRHPEVARRIRQRFAQLRPVSPKRVRGVADGDDLDPDALVAAMVDRRTGSTSDERLYTRRDPLERDVAAAFLVDMSASTSLILPDPQTEPARSTKPAPAADAGALLYGLYDDVPAEAAARSTRRVIDVSRDALALMAEGLAALGDSHAIFGFSGSGRDNIEFHIAKGFDEPVRRSNWAALAAMEPRGSTRMGPAIRHAVTRLVRQPAPLRLLILVSDGYPQDTDYGPDRRSEEYGIQDTAQALREAERAGIIPFCVTIDPGGHDYLRRMCRPDRYRVIEDVESLPQALGEVYAALTARAAGPRR